MAKKPAKKVTLADKAIPVERARKVNGGANGGVRKTTDGGVSAHGVSIPPQGRS